MQGLGGTTVPEHWHIFTTPGVGSPKTVFVQSSGTVEMDFGAVKVVPLP